MRTFNKQIENGSMATNAILQSATAYFSGAAASAALSGLIRDGVKYNAMLEQQGAAFETLLGSADRAKQRLQDLSRFAASTPFELPEIVGASKVLQSFAGDALATGDGLRLVGDSAAAIGRPIGEVAMWMGRLYAALANGAPAGEAVSRLTEMGLVSGATRQHLAALEGQALASSDVMRVLADSFGYTAGAMARQSTTLNGLLSTLRDNVRSLAGRATEALTVKLKQLVEGMIALSQRDDVVRLLMVMTDKLTGIAQVITGLISLFSTLGPNGQQVLISLVDVGTKLGVVLGGLVGLSVLIKGAWMGLFTLINPLRAAVVGFAGISFAGALRDLQLFSRELGLLSTVKLASWGQLWVGFIGVVGAAFAGWSLGSFINELEVGGAKIKGWAALVVNSIIALLEVFKAWNNVLKVKVISAATEAISTLKTLYWKGALSIVEALNSVLTRFGKAIPVDGLKKAVAESLSEMAKLKKENEAGVAAAEAVINRVVQNRGETHDVMADELFLPEKPPTNSPTTNPPPTNPNKDPKVVPVDDTKQRADLEQRRELFTLETAIIEAQIEGNQLLVDALTRERDERQMLNDLGVEAGDIIQARLSAEGKLSNQQKQRAKNEQDFSRSIAGLEAQLAIIEQNKYTTQKQKDVARIEKLGEINAAIAARIALLEKEQLLNPETARQGMIDELRGKVGQNSAAMVAAEPQPMVDQARVAAGDLNDTSKHYQSVGDGMQGGAFTGLKELGTVGDDAAASIRDNLNGALQSTQGMLYNLATGAMSFRQAWGAAILQVGQQFLQSMTMMVAKMIWRATIERALIALGVTIHVAGEQTKTGASMWGGMKRLAITAKEALADVYHGAVSAFKALASIPYVGPILGAAAMAAALAGGMALVKNIAGHEDGGIVQGGRQLSWLNESGREAVIKAPSVRKFGTRFLADLNDGALNLAALPASIASQIPSAYDSTAASTASNPSRRGSYATNPQALLDQERREGSGGFNGSVIVAMGEDYLHDAMASTTGERLVVRASSRNRQKIGIRT